MFTNGRIMEQNAIKLKNRKPNASLYNEPWN